MSARRTEVSPIVEADIVATIDHWFELIGAAMTGDGGRLVMRNEFLRQLQASDAATLPTEIIMAAAESGNEAADAALRIYIAERVNHGLELTRQLAAYNVKSLLRPPMTYPRGHTDVVDSWTRDIGISVLVDVTAKKWSLPPTRGRKTPQPSAAYFVSKVLCQHGLKLKEQQLGRIFKGRSELAKRIAGTLFPSGCAF